MNIVGGISGAALGYISGGIRGARLGYKYGSEAGKSYQNKNMPAIKRAREVEFVTSGTKRRRVQKGKYVVSNKRKVYRRKVAKQRKQVKNSMSAFKKKVKAVVNSEMHKVENVGIFRKNALLDQKVHFDRKDIDYYVVGARFGNANNSPFTLKACKFTPLSAERILDAASVLYNNKTVTYDATVETGNFDITKTKVNLIYGSYEMSMRNLTNVGLYIDIIEVTNKNTTDSDEFFYNANLEKGFNNITAGPDSLFIDTASDNIWVTTKNLKFSDIKEVTDEYGIKRLKSRFLAPGSSIKHTWTERNKVVDFRKFAQSGNLLSDYVKGDKQIIIKVTPRIHMVYKSGEHGVATYATANEDYTGLCFEINEVFKIAQPENTVDAYEGSKTIIWNENRITPSEAGTPLIRDMVDSGRKEGFYGAANGIFSTIG